MMQLRVLLVAGVLLLTLGAAPVGASSPPAVAVFSSSTLINAESAACGPLYTVKWGDTLRTIARRCGTTILALLNANPGIRNPNRIYPGQQLYIPGGAPQPPTPPGPAPATYVIKLGDTLANIAYRFHTSVDALLKANPSILNPDRIYVGQVINVPGNSQPPAPPPPPPAPPTVSNVQIPLIAMNTNGPVGCGDTIVMVTRPVSPTVAPLTAALEQLLSIHTTYYGQSGLYDPLYNSNLSIQDVTINNGVATIKLTGTLSLAGECDDPRVAAQFDSIGRQFSTVQSVQVFINGTPLDNLLSGKGV